MNNHLPEDDEFQYPEPMTGTPLLDEDTIGRVIDRHGAPITVTEFFAILDDTLLTTAASATLTQSEYEALSEDWPLSPEEEQHGAELERRQIQFAMREIAGSTRLAFQETLIGLSTNQVAEILHTNPAHVRKMRTRGELYSSGRKAHNEYIFPEWQFIERQPLPHLARVIRTLPAGMHPLAIKSFMTDSTEDLAEYLEGMSPAQWLATGHDPDIIIQLADMESYTL